MSRDDTRHVCPPTSVGLKRGKAWWGVLAAAHAGFFPAPPPSGTASAVATGRLLPLVGLAARRKSPAQASLCLSPIRRPRGYTSRAATSRRCSQPVSVAIFVSSRSSFGCG
ncbi:Piso0_005816 [Millerozyma farinosa CBS 7064]|uniref:Piso0_005816 protein n=1 Tax=Pichia sorbitophila (strain ATCC MYA-4447 / BCRC 22081 / CBS 7064 / NBRC 10061 / NRRL Y-12695) TaxID=559304 RepID=G8Y011_PICSO|nr:Piso0_005816 [Millerozyma farinosa CBS 7064]